VVKYASKATRASVGDILSLLLYATTFVWAFRELF
jgi:hypothetical protein